MENSKPRHLDSTLSPSERAEALLREMTPQEKIGQLCKLGGFKAYERSGGSVEINDDFKSKFAKANAGIVYGLLRADWWSERNWENGIPPRLAAEAANKFQRYAIENTRLGIPLLFAEEAPHGLMALGATVFPTGLGMASTWNPELVKKAAEAIREESASAGIHTVFGPILEMPRDPRWSRVEEDFSEDPLLTSSLGRAYVEGLQGERLPKRGGVFSTLKHFAAHGEPEGGHNAAPAHLGPVELRNMQLKPFKACVKAGALSLMSAYNVIDGVPCAANRALLTDILRKDWGFEGFVVADGGGLPLLRVQRFAGDEAEACAMALKAGLDAGSVGCFDFERKGLKDALERGLLSIDDLNQALKRLLTVKFRLGLFDDPYFKTGDAAEIFGSKGHRETALEMARQSLVLLSNKNRALPLRGAKRIAVIGPNADMPMNQLGDYTAPQRREDVSTALDGMKRLAKAHGAEVRCAKGCKVRSLRRDLLDEALEVANWADSIVLVLGGSSAPDGETGFLENGASRIKEVQENPEFDKESGEGYDRAKLRLGGLQLELLRTLKATGKRVATVLVMGRPLILDEAAELSDALLLAWYPGGQGGLAIAEALFGELNPGGKLPVSIPQNEAQLPVYYNSPAPRSDYIDLEGKPSFSFGFGLSYAKFKFSDIKLDKSSIAPDGAATVSATIENSSEVAGDEVAQLYLTACKSSVSRPWRELCGFKRIHLKAGESKRVSFKVGPEELGVYGSDLKWRVEPGLFKLALGGGLDAALETELKVE